MLEIKGNSSCIESLKVDPIRGRAEVHFKDGGHYKYWNVSRSVLTEAVMNTPESLGQWVSTYLVHNTLLTSGNIQCQFIG